MTETQTGKHEYTPAKAGNSARNLLEEVFPSARTNMARARRAEISANVKGVAKKAAVPVALAAVSTGLVAVDHATKHEIDQATSVVGQEGNRDVAFQETMDKLAEKTNDADQYVIDHTTAAADAKGNLPGDLPPGTEITTTRYDGGILSLPWVESEAKIPNQDESK